MKQFTTQASRLTFAVVAIMLLTAMSTTAWGQLLMNENFSYSTGDLTIGSGAGTNQSGGNWVPFSSAGSLIMQVGSGSLTFTGYASSGIGNKITLQPGSAEDAYRAFTTTTTGTVYASFLVNVTSTTGMTANSSTVGDYFAGFLPSSSTTLLDARVSVRVGSVAGTYNLGIRASSTNATTTFKATDYATSVTHLIVISYQFVAGTTNDVMNMWIDPTIGGSLPAADVSQTNAATDLADVGRFFFRQGTSAVNATTDGIRIGLTWSDVTGSVAAPTVTTGASSGVTTSAASLAGTVISNNGSTTASFNYGTTLSYGSSVTAAESPVDNGYGSTNITGALSSLAGNTLYHWRATGTNTAGTGTGSDATFTTVPNAPTTTAATSVAATSFTANWTPGAGGTPASYTLDVAVDAGFSSMVSGYPLAGITSTSQSVTGLTGGTTYFYRVRAVDVGGTSANSNTTTVLTRPGAPTATAGTSITPVSFTANWTTPGGTVTGYRLDVATDIGFTSFVSGYSDRPEASTSDGVTGLTQSTIYYCRVRAENASGTSANSNTITVTTQSSTASSNSDIVNIASSEATTISSLINDPGALTSSNGIQVWKFRVRDGGGAPDADGLPTQLLSVTLTQDSANEVPNWSNALLAADLFLDSTNTPHLSSGTIGATSISFSGFTASADDDGTKDLIVRVSLKNPLGSGVADHQNFGFKITNTNVTAGDFSTSSQFASFAKARSDNALNEISVIATKLSFTTQPPASAQTSTDISTAVSGTDANGNIDPDYSGSVTLARAAGTGGFYAASTLSHGTVSGTASWSDLRYNTVEAGVTINASGSLTSATSTAVTFTGIVNSQSDVVTNSGETATISSLVNDPPPLTSVQGSQVWSLTVRDGGATAPDTDALPTILTGVTLTKNGSNTVPDWSTAIRAADLFDGSTHLDSGEISASSIVFAAFSASAPDNGTKNLTVRISLKNPLPAGSDGKKFVFSVLPTNVTAAASGSSQFNAGAATASSDIIKDVIDVTATKLLFVGNVPNTRKDSAFTASARATDANGNTDVGFGNSVTFLKTGGPGTLTGNAPVAPALGVATSSTLKIDTGGRDTLSASATGVTTATSNSFVIISTTLFKVAAGPSNIPSAAGPMQLFAVDTLNWDSTSTWKIISGGSVTGTPHSLDSVILDHTFRATAYTIKCGPTLSDSAMQVTIGYPGNVVPVAILIPPNNRAKPAFFFGNGTTGDYDMVISAGGTFYDNKDTAGSASGAGGNVVFKTLADSMSIRTGGLWYHSSPAFNTMHRVLSRKIDGDYGTVEFDVDVSHYTGIFDASGGGNYYYPNVVFSNTHSFSTYFWFGSGATTIHGNLTVNAGAKDSMMLSGYPFLVHGNIVNNGTIIATTSQLVFDGTAARTVSGNPMTLNAGLLSLNPAGATFLSNVNITGGIVQTTGNFTYDSSGLPTLVTRPVVGTISTGSSTMFLNTAGSLNEGSNPVQGNVSATRTAVQNANEVFGSIGYEINAAGGAPGSTTINRKTGAGSTSTGNGHQSIKRYYDVTPTNNTGMNATVGFSYATTELNGIVETALLLQKSTNAGATWSGKNGTVNTSLHKITAAGVNSFSRWTAASVDSPLFITHTITIRKYSDADGLFGTAGDETLKKWRFSLYKDSVVSADSVAGGNPNSGVLTVPNLEAGTYIAVEGDSTSFGWTRLGKVHNGTRVATTTRFDTIVVSGGIGDSVDFINHLGAFTPNSITVRKFEDADGDFSTSGDRTLKTWYIEVRDTGNVLLGSTNDTALTVSSLADNMYVATEADSTGWIHLGYVLNGVPVSGSANSATLSLAGGQHGTVDFVNASPLYSAMYRSFRQDSIANDKDNKQKVGKFVKRKADKVDFVARVIGDAGTVNGLHMEFGNAILLNYPFFTTPGSTHTSPDGKNKKWDFAFTSPVHTGDTVFVHGFGDKGKVQKVSKYYWENGTTQVGTKKKDPLFVRNDPKLPMPNRVNALFETFAQLGFGANGLLIGRDRTADSLKQYGWILAPKYTDVLKSLKDKTGLHTGPAKGFDKFTSGKDITKRQKSIPPGKQNNMLIADMIALKLNIAASMLLKTPLGFGELIYNDTASNPYNGMMVKEIAAKADTLMMGRYVGAVHTFAAPSVFQVLDTTIQRINRAFEGAMDTLDFAVKLHLKGTKKLADVSYLHANLDVVPAKLIPLDRPIVETPQEYKLYQNYPNPFNPTTTISFDLMEQSVVTLKIYNILGQEVATLFDHAMLDDGTQEVDFNGANLASGVYFYRLITEPVVDPDAGVTGQQFTNVKKMLLIK